MKKNLIKTLIGISLLVSLFKASDHPNTNITIIIMLFILYLIYVLGVKLLRKNKASKKTQTVKTSTLSKERAQHYEELNMSEQQVTFFRQTMQVAKEQIEQLDKNMQSVTKLKGINQRTDVIKISKSLFKRLADEPNKLHQADGFLYHHLPNILELTEKYIEINNHEIKTKTSYEVLDKSTQMIEKVAGLLLEDYERFVADDMEELDVELTVAEQNLARHDKAQAEEINQDKTK